MKAAGVWLDMFRSEWPTSGQIRQYLDSVNVQWKLLDYSLHSDHGELALFVALTTEKILLAMDAATALFETLS